MDRTSWGRSAGGVVVVALLLGAASCNCDSPPCSDACPAAGATRCEGTQVETCATGANRCLAWSAPGPCGGSQTCSGTACTTCPAATACPLAGATRCEGSQVEACALDGTGCLAWSSPASCGDQHLCTGAACAACPAASACADAGATRCSGLEQQTCASGADGCRAWAAPASCGAQAYCSGTSCAACAVASPCAAAGATRCAGDAGVETCAADVNGCLGWSAPAACGPQRLCLGSGCAALYLYATGNTAGTYGFSLDPGTGALAELSGSPFPAPGNRVVGHPSGRFLYVSDENTARVSAYAVHADGSLSAVGTFLGTGGSPEAPAVSPEGRYLYLGTVAGGGTDVFAIDPTTGGLSPATPPLVSFGSWNHGVAFHPSGRYVYLSRNNSDDVTRFAFDAGTGAAFEPRTLAAAGGYHSAIDPLGRFLYVSDWDKSGANLVSSYALSPTDGTLTRVGDFPTGGGNPSGVAVTADGRFVYVVNYSSGTVAGFAVAGGADAGALTAVPGSPFPVGLSAWELSLDPRGRFLFIGHGAVVSAFAIDGTTGGLADAGVVPARAASTTVGASAVVAVPQ